MLMASVVMVTNSRLPHHKEAQQSIGTVSCGNRMKTEDLPLMRRFSPSQCSVTCGVGKITRHVDCSNYHQPVDQSFCDPDEKPSMEQECIAAPCPSVYRRQRINDQPYGYPQDPGRHPGHSSWNVPSADNQWRTGPWGAVCSADIQIQQQQRLEGGLFFRPSLFVCSFP